MKNSLEIACFNLQSCLTAQKAGADRLELCLYYESGGITPSDAFILDVRKNISIPVYVIIRPRAGNFIYSPNEIEQMKRTILFCKENKIDGVVFGVLTHNVEVDVKTCAELLALARPMPVTFHRAVDYTEDVFASVETIIGLGFDKVLTSGGSSTAVGGLERLTKLQEKYGQKIKIITVGNIRSHNIKKIKATGCFEFHSSAIITQDANADENEIRKMKEEISAKVNL